MAGPGMASDFDGTIGFVRREPRFRPCDLEAVARFRSMGGLFGVSTGRPYYGVLDAARGEISFDFFILTSGAEILGADGAVLRRTTVGRDELQDIDESFARGNPSVVHAGGRLYSRTPTSAFQIRVGSFADIPDGCFCGISFYAGDAGDARSIAADINTLRPGMTAFHNGSIVDVVRRGCSKGDALRFVKRHYGITSMAAAGDSNNDVPMFEAADMSFTFHESPEDVRAAADHVVSGMAEALGIFMKTCF